MAELAVEAIRKRSQARVRVVNRTLHGAQRLANRWGGQAATFDALPELLTQVDILITSTGAPHTVIHRELVSAILPAREGRPLVIIDIAMPRDVDIDVGSLPGVRLFDIDTLHEHLEYSLARRAGEVPQVESILAEEAQIFMDYLRTLNVIPLIAEMSRQAEQIRLLELEKSLRRLPDLTQEEQERLDALTRALVSKLLHAPITTLRQEAGGPQAARYAAAVRDLFGLQTDSGS